MYQQQWQQEFRSGKAEAQAVTWPCCQVVGWDLESKCPSSPASSLPTLYFSGHRIKREFNLSLTWALIFYVSIRESLTKTNKLVAGKHLGSAQHRHTKTMTHHIFLACDS